MAFRISSVMVALVMAAAASAENLIEICHITSDVDPKTFETIFVTNAAYPSYETAGDMDGPCMDMLGELCDDGMKCTVDFDEETMVCLPLPRDMMAGCVEDA